MLNLLTAVTPLLLGAAISVCASAANAAEPVVAGLTPDRRPEGAPVITEVLHDEAWRERALTGVSEPYPQSILDWLDDQGAWYTPFNRPGMRGLYDIRGWHQPASAR